MKWISKKPPLYVWEGDHWYCEIDKQTYSPDLSKCEWISENNSIPFLPKSKVMK